MKKIIIFINLILFCGVGYFFYEYNLPPKFLDNSLLSKITRIEVSNDYNQKVKVITNHDIIKKIISNLKFKRSPYIMFSFGTSAYVIKFINADISHTMTVNNCNETAEMNFADIEYIYYTKLNPDACGELFF